jgi:hypothetical protein
MSYGLSFLSITGVYIPLPPNQQSNYLTQLLSHTVRALFAKALYEILDLILNHVAI